jgi:cell pole-organizing protein PopZ
MTRLDASNDPSMEDILASIRKIIAEDPPGSRPAPPATLKPLAAPTQNGFGRLSPAAEALFQTEAVTTPVSAPTPEPYLRATPAPGSQPNAFSQSPFFAAKPVAAPVARVEPVFAPVSAPVVDAALRAETAPAETVAEPVSTATNTQSVEDQLSDLLEDVAAAASSAPVAPAAIVSQTQAEVVPAKVELAKPVSDFAAKLIGRPTPVASPAMVADIAVPGAKSEVLEGQRPGFTVSHDGFVPERAPANKESDPFEFDLGPSPFLAKSSATSHATSPAADLPERLLKNSVELPDSTLPAIIAEQSEPVTAKEVSETSASVEVPEGAKISPQEAVFVLPSIEAVDLLPQVSSLTSNSSVVSDVAAYESAQASMQVVPEDPAPVAVSFGSPVTPVASFASRSGFASPAIVPAATASTDTERTSMLLADTAQRSMEDTVADLLRPMLKSWLADNMPKIVERALRRETSERLLSEHKTAAE